MTIAIPIPLADVSSVRDWLNGALDPVAAILAAQFPDLAAGWRRTFVRYHPDHASGCTLLYQTGSADPNLLVAVEVACAPSNAANASLVLRRFPADPALPTLSEVWRSVSNARVVRYRPGHRCTLESRTNDAHFFIKVFGAPLGWPIHCHGERLWQASRVGELGFAVPRPGYWDAGLSALWQHALLGAPLGARLLSADGLLLAARLGHAAATLPASNVRFETNFSAADQQRRTARYVEELCVRLPTHTRMLDMLMAQLAKVAQRPVSPPRPIHGALHSHQWLEADGRLGLVDFDRLCMGEPELDVATFATELAYERDAAHAPAALVATFREAYAERAGALDPARLAFYAAHKHLAKALKCVRGVRADAERRAIRALDNARQAVEECT